MKEYSKAQKINRRGWPHGPWDSEPDFHEWTTQAGYEAYAARLDSGTWFGIVIAPFPKHEDDCSLTLAFAHTLRDMRRRQFDHHIGMVGQSDVEGMSEYCVSMEHYQSPIEREKSRGPYKTLEEVKQICEDVAQDISVTLKEGNYVNYFRR